MLSLALLIAAILLFALAAIGVPSRVGLGWLGLVCFAAADLATRMP
jgi:hypothetical protein